jgi:Nucleotidyltransferase domain
VRATAEVGVDVQFPTRLHEAVLEKVLAVHRADAGVLGVLLCGSLARGTAREDSDIDLLLVLADDEAKRSYRKHYGSIVVEQNARTPADWIQQFTPSRIRDESWGYAFLDGVILHDPHGEVARLAAAAADD